MVAFGRKERAVVADNFSAYGFGPEGIDSDL